MEPKESNKRTFQLKVRTTQDLLDKVDEWRKERGLLKKEAYGRLLKKGLEGDEK